MSRLMLLALMLAASQAASLTPAPAAAQTPIVLNAETGAVFDAVFDGYPQLAAFDGQPDFLSFYQTLSVALQRPITELRGIGEFPLAALDGTPTSAVSRATLTFNIDDVIGSFGPGTGFSGTAARDIVVHLYAGNGTVEIADYLATDRPPHAVDTRSRGAITDAALTRSGPQRFDIDVTDDVREILDGGAGAIGILWRTTDSPTATSLDHLGQEGAGPPGVHGAFLPFLTIEIAAASPTATASATPEPPTGTPTATPTPSLPPVPTVTESPTLTPPAPTATRAATPTSAPHCPGDCNSDGAVTVDEIVLGVSLALGTSSSPCTALDADGDGAVTITDLVRVVAAALDEC